MINKHQFTGYDEEFVTWKDCERLVEQTLRMCFNPYMKLRTDTDKWIYEKAAKACELAVKDREELLKEMNKEIG